MRREFPIAFRKTIPLDYFPAQVDEIQADVLEIGPGRGDFLIEMAAMRPHTNFVAVELAGKRFRKLCARLTKRGIENVTLIRGDARVVLERHGKPKRFESIFVLFPDPWPKNRHTYHRLLTVPMLTFLSLLLKEDGSLYLATDDENYFRWAISNSRQVPTLSYAPDGNPQVCPIEGYRPTYFETKWRNDGRTIWYARFSRAMAADEAAN